MKKRFAAAAASLVLPGALLLPASTATAGDPAPARLGEFEIGSTNPGDGKSERFKLAPGTATHRLAQQVAPAHADGVRAQADEDPAPTGATIISPATGTDVAGDFQVTVSRGGAVHLSLWVDGTPMRVDGGSDETVVFDLNLTGPAAGQSHTIEVGDCSTGYCLSSEAGDVTDSITVTAYPELGVDVTSASSSGYFSPDGDGTKDAVTVTYTTQVAGTVTATVTRVSDSTVVRTAAIGSKAADAYSFAWNGKDDGGTLVADGTYRVDISLATSGGSTVRDGVNVVLDTTNPSLTSLKRSDSKVFPRKDKYRDWVTFSAKLSEKASLVKLKITNSRGKTVRTLSTKSVSGTVALKWSGRTSSGTLLAEGTYKYRWTATDLAGNVKSSSAGSIVVDNRILKKKVRTKTISPRPYRFVSFIGDCSYVVKNPNGWSNGHGYRSLAKAFNGEYCEGLDDENSGTDEAWVRYKFVVPKAVKYGSVRVGALGKGRTFSYNGESFKGYGGLGLMGYDGSNLYEGPFVLLKPSYKTYWTSSRSFKDLGWGRTVLWDAGTDSGFRYDIRKFKVKWTYYVLVD